MPYWNTWCVIFIGTWVTKRIDFIVMYTHTTSAQLGWSLNQLKMQATVLWRILLNYTCYFHWQCCALSHVKQKRPTFPIDHIIMTLYITLHLAESDTLQTCPYRVGLPVALLCIKMFLNKNSNNLTESLCDEELHFSYSHLDRCTFMSVCMVLLVHSAGLHFFS